MFQKLQSPWRWERKTETMHTDIRKNYKVYNFSMNYFKPPDNKCDHVENYIVAVMAMNSPIKWFTIPMNFSAPIFSHHID